jgi:hypothetical protein
MDKSPLLYQPAIAKPVVDLEAIRKMVYVWGTQERYSFMTTIRTKQSLLLALFILAGLKYSVAQNDVAEITLDFKTKKFSGIENVTSGTDYYRLTINNINLNLYKISYKSKDTTFKSTVEFPALTITGLDAIATMIDKLPGLSSLSTQAAALVAIDSSMGTPENFVKGKDKDKKPKMPEYLDLRAKVETHKNFVIERNLNIKGQYVKIDGLLFDIRKKSLSYIAESSELKTSLDGGKELQILLDCVAEKRTELKTIEADLLSDQQVFQLLYTTEAPKFNADTVLKKAGAELLAMYTASYTANSKLYAAVSADTLFSTIKSLVLAENNNTGTYISLPVRMDGDQAKLDLTIQGKAGYDLPDYHTSILFPDAPRAYAGLGASFYYSNMRSDAYSISAVAVDSATTNYTIVNEYHQPYEIGFATLLHVGYKFCDKRNVAWNFAVGPAFSLTKVIKPRLTAGTGVSFGKKQMISIDYLVIGGYVDRLSNAYSEGTNYSAEPESVVVSKLQFAGAIAVGYIYKF